MKARHIILAIAAIAVLAAPTAVLAQAGPGPGDGSGPGSGWGGGRGPHGGGRGPHDGGMGGDHLGFFEHALPRLAEELGLSDEQIEKIQAIVDGARPEIDRLSGLMREGREAYRAANDDPTTFNEGAFRSHAAEQNQLHTDLMVVIGKSKAEVFKVFTPEQLEQLEEMRGSFGKRAFRRGAGRRPVS